MTDRPPCNTFVRMSFAFVPPVPSVEDFSGLDISVWLEVAWDRAVFSNGTAMVFRNMTAQGGRPGAFVGTPLLRVVDYRATMTARMRAQVDYTKPSEPPRAKRVPKTMDDASRRQARADHAAAVAKYHKDRQDAVALGEVQPWDVVVPLGVPDWSNVQTQVVLQQAARLWVSGGTNAADMADHHVVVMVFSALESLVLAGLTQDVQPFFSALWAIAQALWASLPVFRTVCQALVVTPGADNMVHKTIAHALVPGAPWDTRAKLEILELAVRRHKAWGDHLPAPALVLFPFVSTSSMSFPAVVTAFQETVAGVAPPPGRSARTKRHGKAAQVVGMAVSCAGVTTFTMDHALELLSFFSKEKYVDACVPWEAWGLVDPTPSTAHLVRTAKFPHKGRTNVAAFAARVSSVSIAPPRVRIVGFKGVVRSGVQVLHPGRCSLELHPLLHAQEMQWLLTFGEELDPNDMPVLYDDGSCRKRDARSAEWATVDAVGGRPRDRALALELDVGADRVSVDGGTWVLERPPGLASCPVLFSFANLWVEATFP